MLLKSKSTSLTKLVNFLLHVIFKIKDFIGHYLNLEVHQDYTEFALMSIVYFEQNYIIPKTAVFGPTNFIGTTTTASTARMTVYGFLNLDF